MSPMLTVSPDLATPTKKCLAKVLQCVLPCVSHGALDVANITRDKDHVKKVRLGQSRSGVLNLLLLMYLQINIDPLCVLPSTLLFTFCVLILIQDIVGILLTPYELLAYPQGYPYPRLRINGLCKETQVRLGLVRLGSVSLGKVRLVQIRLVQAH